MGCFLPAGQASSARLILTSYVFDDGIDIYFSANENPALPGATTETKMNGS